MRKVFQNYSIENTLQIKDLNIISINIDNSNPEKLTNYTKLTYPLKNNPICDQFSVIRFGTILINARIPAIKQRPFIF